MDAFVVGAGEGEVVPNPVGRVVTFKVLHETSGGALTVLESEVAPGEGPPLHTHEVESELLYVLEGSFRFQHGEEISEGGAGAMMFIPPGAAHCFQNIGEDDGKLLVVFSPAGMEDFFRITDGDRAKLAAVGARLGMQVVGPPLAARGE